ncbi:MAG: hypothetical protein IPG58_15625 [Acidobacteria bacterium]|nr:hypothetical protein [Acidobacteriota bacterium]
MKNCPSCNQIFTDDNDFCLNDGTLLVFASAGLSNNVPTEVVQYRQTSQSVPQPDGGSSNILYLLIGVLATALVGIGIYLFVSRDSESRAENRNSAPAPANSQPQPNTATPATTSNLPPNINAATPPERPATTVSPNGNWTGNISYPSGSAFSAKASFSDTGSGQVSGQILWTLLKTSNPQKAGLVGSSATEFVRGNFDSATRTLSVAGYDTDDPTGNLVIVDKYRLTISSDGRSISGFSYGGKSRGRFSLRK